MLSTHLLEQAGLTESDRSLLQKIGAALPIVSDVCRADLLLYLPAGDGQAVMIAQAQPHSVSPLYAENRVGTRVDASTAPEVIRGLSGHSGFMSLQTIYVRGATVARQICPVRNDWGQVIALLCIDSYWLAYERHRRRGVAFQEALKEFVDMVLRGELHGAENLSPFGEHDGLMFVGANGKVEYMSGIALSMYRRLGFRDSLVGVPVEQLDTVDSEMVSQVLGSNRPLERTDEQYGLTWVRVGLPINALPAYRLPLIGRRSCNRAAKRGPEPYGVLITLHDATEALETQRELESKTALIREVHHRVKNNLQVIASLIRMQARRAQSEEARTLLEESVNRILSVAVVHEFLSQNAQGTINLQDVSNRILAQVQQGLVDSSKEIHLKAVGTTIWLPAERATQCALVINELVQNAIEHGIATRDGGSVEVELADEGERVQIIVSDNGVGLPEGFDLETHSHLGLRIVRNMVERDLKGQFDIISSEAGTRAVVQFNKAALEVG